MVLSPRQPLNGQRVRRIPGWFKIATWNVRSIYESGKTHNVIKEMKRLHVQIMGLSETRWPDAGECTIQDHWVYYSGNNDPDHRNGVGIIINKNIKSALKSFIPVSDRIIMIKLHAFPMDINIIQIYAPTAEKEDIIVEEFYEQLETLIKQNKKHEITIVLGDFNAKIGQGRHSDIVGNFGQGMRNERGDRLIQFCEEHNLVISNTVFQSTVIPCLNSPRAEYIHGSHRLTHQTTLLGTKLIILLFLKDFVMRLNQQERTQEQT